MCIHSAVMIRRKPLRHPGACQRPRQHWPQCRSRGPGLAAAVEAAAAPCRPARGAPCLCSCPLAGDERLPRPAPRAAHGSRPALLGKLQASCVSNASALTPVCECARVWVGRRPNNAPAAAAATDLRRASTAAQHASHAAAAARRCTPRTSKCYASCTRALVRWLRGSPAEPGAAARRVGGCVPGAARNRVSRALRCRPLMTPTKGPRGRGGRDSGKVCGAAVPPEPPGV
eukprot:359593-Chlamydomonas_euryale.AAC.1